MPFNYQPYTPIQAHSPLILLTLKDRQLTYYIQSIEKQIEKIFLLFDVPHSKQIDFHDFTKLVSLQYIILYFFLMWKEGTWKQKCICMKAEQTRRVIQFLTRNTSRKEANKQARKKLGVYFVKGVCKKEGNTALVDYFHRSLQYFHIIKIVVYYVTYFTNISSVICGIKR